MDERGDVMSLVIYYKREAVPCEIQEFNDSYFDIFTPLEDNSLTREILRDIDQAEYLDKDGFSGRSKSGMWISREYLSTGTKTLLNILAHPNVCFNVAECGFNVLKKLVSFNTGTVFWDNPALTGLLGDCDIQVDGCQFNTIQDLRRYLCEIRR